MTTNIDRMSGTNTRSLYQILTLLHIQENTFLQLNMGLIKGLHGANQVTDKPEDYYAFVVKGGNDSGGVVDLCVGGVLVENVLIDSGATCNIVDHTTWESLKQKGMKCQSRKCGKKLFAYGQTKPIEVVGTFESEIYCEESGEMCVDEFTVEINVMVYFQPGE